MENMLQGLVLLLLTAIGAIAVVGIKEILKSLETLRHSIGKVNVEVAKVQTSLVNHSEEDERRFGELHNAIKEA